MHLVEDEMAYLVVDAIKQIERKGRKTCNMTFNKLEKGHEKVSSNILCWVENKGMANRYTDVHFYNYIVNTFVLQYLRRKKNIKKNSNKKESSTSEFQVI